MANGLWLTACGLWLVACGLWLMANGLWPVAYGLWQLKGAVIGPKHEPSFQIVVMLKVIGLFINQL